MSNEIEVKVPDIGDFHDVDVIEVLVRPGNTVAVDEPLITVESDKASMDIPSPAAGIVRSMVVDVGHKVSEGSPILVLDVQAQPVSATALSIGRTPAATATAGQAKAAEMTCDLLVLGAGPGGYTAAFRAADLGKQVVLVERWPVLGGVCLNVGCIPSKALLHAAKVLDEAEDFAKHGIRFGKPEVDLQALRGWKDGVVKRLTGGLAGLAKQRKVTVVNGVGTFQDANQVEVVAEDGTRTLVRFENAVIAAGSEPVRLPFMPDDPRIIDSTGALALESVPARMLVIGGGIIGLEMATVYNALGSQVTVVEMLPGIVAGADKDVVKPLLNRIRKRYAGIWLETRVIGVEAGDQGLKVRFDGKQAPAEPQTYDCILVAVGRIPNGKGIGAEKAGARVDERGFVQVVDTQMRTHQPHIFAIGDIIGQPMLAHKAVHEGKAAAEAAAGLASHFDARVIPSVAYTDPEVAWVGLTEEEAKAKGVKIGKGVFPWAASGRALSIARDEGLTKLIFDEQTDRLIGAGIVGPNAGELIAEAAHAIEMGSNAADIGLTVHPHPTLSETVTMAAEAFEGTITDLYLPKKG